MVCQNKNVWRRTLDQISFLNFLLLFHYLTSHYFLLNKLQFGEYVLVCMCVWMLLCIQVCMHVDTKYKFYFFNN